MEQKRHLEFAPLLEQLQKRAERSVVSQYAFKSKPLSSFLRQTFSAAPGTDGALMADPVFEPMFPWQQAEKSMQSLKGELLSDHLVEVLKGIDSPFKHQLTAWKSILEEKKSTLVSSGTGSGKTECFMVPILEDLVRQQQKKKHKLIGTQALFLYPLNALINSQQERLSKWTKDFKGDIRFALYNGETERYRSRVKEDQLERPEQVLSREELWENPPSILVTNATMLEYMLVRKEDEPILQQSQGMLKYIVLDEAHTYVGSQAAELALLLRRVMQAYGVGPETEHSVQIIATSATIGEDTEKGNRQLARYLADLAGVSESEIDEKVQVVRGYRDIPSLPEIETARLDFPFDRQDFFKSLPREELYNELNHYALTRLLRQVFANEEKVLAKFNLTPRPAYQLSQLHIVAKSVEPTITKQQLLNVFDLMTYGKDEEAFTPLRMHAYQRTTSGLWACSNPDCTEKSEALQDDGWLFGQVYTELKSSCSCGAPVFELVSCQGCGSSYLTCEEKLHQGNSYLRPRLLDLDEDEFVLDLEQPEDESADEEIGGTGFERLIGEGGDSWKMGVQPANFGQLSPKEGKAVNIGLLRPVQSESDGDTRSHFRCGCCGEKETKNGSLFRYARLGAPFFLGDMIPTMLEFSPAPADKKERLGPSQGKRLLTFTDSRQGTARISARLQQDADRNTLRTLTYHELTDPDSASGASSEALSQVEELCRTLEQTPMMAMTAQSLRKLVNGEELPADQRTAVEGMPPMLAMMQMTQFVEPLQKLLAGTGKTSASSLPWQKMAQQLANSRSDFDTMRSRLNKLSGLNLDKEQYADFCLYTEFGRRPKKTWSLESLGLVSVQYPQLENVLTVPTEWKGLVTDTDKQVTEWRNFLKIILDFYIRDNSAVFFDNEHYQRWMGAKFPRKIIKGPGVDIAEQKRDLLWPKVRKHSYNRVIKLLIAAFPQIQLSDKFWEEQVNTLMGHAWENIKPLLHHLESGFQLDMKSQVTFSAPKKVWICPYTRKALDVTLCGYSPFLPNQDLRDVFKAKEVDMPSVPKKHWRNDDDSIVPKEERLDWLETNPVVLAARDANMWPNRSDRIAAKESWYRLEEHSAQQNSDVNKANEALFKSGKVNVLNCSTTMEMGVDIGGMSLVAMNNVPPAPANYLQRAGRAGRRGETAAAAVTLCKNTAHGMEVYHNTLWPFVVNCQPPQVRLESDAIVQRHVNAFALGSYLHQKTKDATKLNCEWFFEGEVSQCDKFILWLQHLAQDINNNQWTTDVKRIVKGTSLAHLSAKALIARVLDSIRYVEDRWQEQLEIMLDNAKQLAAEDKNWEASPAGKSVMFQLRDFRGAYLFSTLATKAFLPGHGFPVGVVNFNYQTVEDLGFKRISSKDTKDVANQDTEQRSSKKFASLPSRDLPTALREYAPGADVVLGGKVYRSGGVMLGKVLASGQELTGDSQHLPYFWHCASCGAGATQQTWPSACSHCGEKLKQDDIHRYLQPVGFATDICYESHNDVNQPRQMPFKQPRVLLPVSQWLPLPDPTMGRYRFSSKGEIYHYTEGEFNQGYSVCLSCGRADSQIAAGRKAKSLVRPDLQNTHYRLRGGKTTNDGEGKEAKLCHGKVMTDLQLGYSAQTDVIEIQLRDFDGVSLSNETEAWSLAVSLREGLARHLGIETSELGVSVQQAQDEKGEFTYSIFIFDKSAGGAGYSIQMTDGWKSVFEKAREVLTCRCDSACHKCLLSYDTQFFVDKLDHNAAMSWVSPVMTNRFELSEEHQYLGEDSQFETLPLVDRVRLELGKGNVQRCGVLLSGNTEAWQLDRWPLVEDLIRYAVNYNGKVQLALTESDIEQLDPTVKAQLASYQQLPGCPVELKVVDDKHLLTEKGKRVVWMDKGSHYTVWAADKDIDTSLSETWGIATQGVVVSAAQIECAMANVGKPVEFESLQQVDTANDVRVTFKHELDSSIDDFGDTFWRFIGENHSSLMDKIQSGAEISQVTYNDRFLKSPSTVRIFGEIVTKLNEQANCSDAKLVVCANSLENSTSFQQKIFHDWCEDGERENVLKTMLSEGYLGASWDGDITVFAGDPRKGEVAHARELEIEFTDGTKGYVIFDYGLGFWKIDGYAQFDFFSDYEYQVQRLADMKYQLVAPSFLSSYLIVGFK
ncbi:DEAD/DEAH box helicase [Photobacterium rosenbergii]|uniref:DEAD/DEAH box helicase n=1 Tax=Photobacterium rosenbergii TaxID=294936 RepID=UPI001C99B761|nr:DEAD/DEAH box helicase [Photobacterium rosenbergii]MBY5947898.1 DEAD/DEAH box helicase [Photobacterium rosenbergii]